MDAFILPFLVVIATLFIIINFWCGHKYMSILSSYFLFIAFLLTIAYIIAGTFTGKGIDESVFFHLLYALNIDTLLKFKEYLIITILLFIIIITWIIWFNFQRVKILQSKKKYGTTSFNLFLSILLLGISSTVVITHPATKNIYELYQISIQKNNFSQFEHHVKPVQLHYIFNEKPKNFIYIYVESLERTFLDQQRFPNLVPYLNQLKKNAVVINGIKQAPMTNWTIAGMTASQCGIPLATYSKNQATVSPNLRNNELDNLESFLPGAICIGDILKQYNYYLSYIGGADSSFAGKGNFYSDHGFDEISGKTEILKHFGKDLPLSKWGIYDDILYDYLFEKFEKTAKSHEHFGLVALTLDTHAPLGHETPLCNNKQYQNGNIKMLNSVHCADFLLSKFIQKFKSSPYSKDTVLIIASDHLMMMNNVGLEVNDPTRENLWMAINTDFPAQVLERQATTLDIAPTLLNILGFNTSDFVLGRNLFYNEPTLYERLGEKEFYTQLQAWRMNLWKFWGKDNNL